MLAEPVAGARGASSAAMRQRCEASLGEVPAEPLAVVATTVCVIGSAICRRSPGPTGALSGLQGSQQGGAEGRQVSTGGEPLGKLVGRVRGLLVSAAHVRYCFEEAVRSR